MSQPGSAAAQRFETFGLDRSRSWALPALRLVFSGPRIYPALVDAWDEQWPGTRRALNRLTEAGWVAYQPAVVADCVTGELGGVPARPTKRYRLTARGEAFVEEFSEDLRVLNDRFGKLSHDNTKGVARLFEAARVTSNVGLSARYLVSQTTLSGRTARWWVQRLVATGMLAELPVRVADRREVVPSHWRITRRLCRQLEAVEEAFPATCPAGLCVQLRTRRARYLDDIAPTRIGFDGATDYDHDVTVQQVVGRLLRSERFDRRGGVQLEPARAVPIDTNVIPWRFGAKCADTISYQPDAELLEQLELGDGRRVGRITTIEYERFQSRKDAWSHLERWCGWLTTSQMPGRRAALRFVVDTTAKQTSYVRLIEAFADHLGRHPERAPANPTLVAVATVAELEVAADPLADLVWARIELPRGSGSDARLHNPNRSPYFDYFTGQVAESGADNDDADDLAAPSQLTAERLGDDGKDQLL